MIDRICLPLSPLAGFGPRRLSTWRLHTYFSSFPSGNVLLCADLKSNPYYVVTVGEISDGTKVVKEVPNLVWNRKMSFFVPKNPEIVTFAVSNDDSGGKMARKTIH